MKLILEYQWEIFIGIEVISFISLILFGIVRYLFSKPKMSRFFLLVFFLLLILEAVLAVILYQETGEISTFQIVIIIFIFYACTFGISDFRKLDRWMRLKIGKWRGIDLLTENDKRIMKKQKDPKYIARKYRYSSLVHLLVFVLAQIIFWSYGVNSLEEVKAYLTDLSWISADNYAISPYPSEMLYGVSMVWGIVFVVDFIYSWSYTIFPSTK
ncbi:hypothetical protein [Ornithinibacillus halotolerans]|uniref:Uncharacterized protein n=1 Tax=Ornithinibacillus halotolerans TaxID=1274357 RepID=A0A916RV65_9BACI|nr:hypothetical protein [Ornithinibacillus halotolerans]GGA71302.1 hypothetical protein GCM10008025_13990 [Ornithinibacillus halotolerans]